jgi:hypothetical protein
MPSRPPSSLVYLKGRKGNPIPIILPDDAPTGPGAVLARHKIAPDQSHLTIDELCKIFPAPDNKNEEIKK